MSGHHDRNNEKSALLYNTQRYQCIHFGLTYHALLSAKDSGQQKRALSFRPRWRLDNNYRSLTPHNTKKPKCPLPDGYFDDTTKTHIDIGEFDSDDPMERNYGPFAADAIKIYQNGRRELGIEEQLKFANYLTTENGTTECNTEDHRV